MPTSGLSQGDADPWVGKPSHPHGKHPQASLSLFFGSFLASFFARFLSKVPFHRVQCFGLAALPAQEREREITGVGTVLLLPFFAFKVTFKENILVLTRIYLLYSCIWLLAWVPTRQRSGPAQFKAKTFNERGFFSFLVCVFSPFLHTSLFLLLFFFFFLKQVIHW